MHEMGIVLNIVRDAEQIAKANEAEGVASVVLQIGELTGVIPNYVQICWVAAIEKTLLSSAALIIEEIPGNGICKKCGMVYKLLEHDLKCPDCGSEAFDTLSGREVVIKEIAVF